MTTADPDHWSVAAHVVNCRPRATWGGLKYKLSARPMILKPTTSTISIPRRFATTSAHFELRENYLDIQRRRLGSLDLAASMCGEMVCSSPTVSARNLKEFILPDFGAHAYPPGRLRRVLLATTSTLSYQDSSVSWRQIGKARCDLPPFLARNRLLRKTLRSLDSMV